MVDEESQVGSPSSSGLLSRTGVIIPTFNASSHWARLSESLSRQGIESDQVLIIDSSSTDDTRQRAQRMGYRVEKIRKESFSHGGTRQLAADCLPWAEALVYLTQDAVPAGPAALSTLVSSFGDSRVGAVYGRQIPRSEAKPIETHARMFNYSGQSEVRSFDSRRQLGLRAAFFSNSFAAYRRTALDEVNGFPTDVIVSEDVTVAARMLIAGWKIAYSADAQVFHSHAFSIRDEASRYFDIGVHHARQGWLLEQFGGAGGEGLNFVASELRYLWNTQPSLIPSATMRNMSKWLSYHLGLIETVLPVGLKRLLSAQPNFWRDERTAAGRSKMPRLDNEERVKAGH